MKYTESEEKKVEYHKREIKRYRKMVKKEMDRFVLVTESHKKRLAKIRDYENEDKKKIATIDKKVKKRCKHKGERRRWANLRDDASFPYFIACEDCGEIMWDECNTEKK